MTSFELPWIARARELIGTREVPGPQHNKTILEMLYRLKSWIKDDETPWCGTFVAHCLQAAGLVYPKHWYRALAYRDYGTAESLDNIPYGAIAIKGRKGGGHVFFAVAQSPSGIMIYGLGGNQNNAVNIAAFSRRDILAVRWPSGANVSKRPLPVVRSAAELNAAVNVNEA